MHVKYLFIHTLLLCSLWFIRLFIHLRYVSLIYTLQFVLEIDSQSVRWCRPDERQRHWNKKDTKLHLRNCILELLLPSTTTLFNNDCVILFTSSLSHSLSISLSVCLSLFYYRILHTFSLSSLIDILYNFHSFMLTHSLFLSLALSLPL